MDVLGNLNTSGFRNYTGEVIRGNPWGQLHGGHHLHPPSGTDISQCIYMKRDVMDTAFSIYNFKLPSIKRKWGDLSFKEFININLKKPYWRFTGYKETMGLTVIESIIKHHRIWENTGIYTVEYEELYKKPRIILRRIGNKFNLSHNAPLQPLKTLVGWKPAKGKPNEGRKECE